MVHDRFKQLQTAFGSGVAQRATLFVNHLLAAEPAALARLRPHAGRRIELRVSGGSAWLQPTPLVFEVTPAGRLDLEAAVAGAPADLRMCVDVSDPLAGAVGLLGGARPSVAFDGDAAFAGDMRWLVENLRWHVEDDLEPVVGAAAARGIARAGAGAAALARDALGALASLRKRGDSGR